jgi:hypothetical protein
MGVVLAFTPAPSRKEPYTAGAVIVGFKPSPDSPLGLLYWVKQQLYVLLKRANVERPAFVGDVQESIRLFGEQYNDFLTDAECREKWLRAARLA